MKGQSHSQEVRAVVISALMEGQSVSEVSASLNLSKSVVSRLKKEIDSTKLEQVGTVKKEKLIDLVESHLIASLRAAIQLAEQAHDANWRSKQPASEIAVFYGVLSDKSIRLIEIAGKLLGQQASE